MDLKLFNQLTKKRQTFKPLKNKKVGFYTCGPTVYDAAHIGNLRTYIFEDVLKRALKANGYKVKQVMNVTDIEDKIIKKMKAQGKTLKQLTQPYTKIFFKDLEKLNIERADVYPKATQHIKEMIDLINSLLKKGYAYKAEDNSVYFKITKFKNYGKLAAIKKERLKKGRRIDTDEYAKNEAVDFALWKAARPGEPAWNSPFGRGRPGWHIECSAMSMKYLGKSFDIHSGAVDLIFPHHENEIAQAEASTGKKFANFWIEGEHLLVDNKKMAKSLGNFYTLRNIEKKGFDPLAFRYLILTTHYRSKLNFTWKSLEASQNALDRLKQFMMVARDRSSGKPNSGQKYEKRFYLAINDNLNTPKALAVLWEVIKDEKLSTGNKQKLILKFDEVLGLRLNKVKPIKIPGNILKLVEKREDAREEKKWKEADKIREEIQKAGWQIKDTSEGPKLIKT